MSGRLLGALRRALPPALAVTLLSQPGARTHAATSHGCPGISTKHVCVLPAQMRAAYGVDALLKRGVTGRGRTIALIVSFGSATLRHDLHVFDRTFGLPDPHLEVRAPLGANQLAESGWRAETTLDVEWAHVMAPGANLLVMTSPVDETEGLQGLPQFFQLESDVVTHHRADVISQSWAATENTLLDARGRAMVARFHGLYARASAQGVTVLGASGDNGTAGLDQSVQHFYPFRVVQWPAADPLVLAVGGTQLDLTSSGPRETAWPGSGGGNSTLYSEPAYQRSLPAAIQSRLHGRRGVPDVALNASRARPVPIYVNGRWGLAAGTSAAAPQWAGMIALADSLAGRDLGDIHSRLYRLSRTAPRDFHDVTSGAIQEPPGARAERPLRALPGWDPATGLGTPRADRLLPDLARQSR